MVSTWVCHITTTRAFKKKKTVVFVGKKAMAFRRAWKVWSDKAQFSKELR